MLSGHVQTLFLLMKPLLYFSYPPLYASLHFVTGLKNKSINNSPFCCSRVIKSKEEIDVLRYVVKVSSEAHKAVMKIVRPRLCEFQAEAAFLHYAYAVGGCRHVSYTCICGSGHNSSILHYGHAGAPNNKVLKDGDMW